MMSPLLRFLFLVAFVCPLLALTAGCSMTTAVTFDTHAPHRAPHRVNTPLLIVLPDGIESEKTRVTIPSVLWTKDRFDVYHGQALRSGADARFRNMFTDIFVVSESIYNEIRAEEGLPPITLSEEPSDGRGKKDGKDRPETLDQERIRELLEFVPWFAREPNGHVLLLQRPRYAYSEGRSIIAVQATLLDRFTDEPIMEGTMRGQSPRVTPRKTTELRHYELHKSVLGASSILFTNMRDRVNQSITENITGGG